MIVLLGPVHPYRGGGIVSFNERLLKALQDEGQEVMVFNFKVLYPKMLFPGKSQITEEPYPLPYESPRIIHSFNPFNWITTGRKLNKISPDIILVRYWLPFLGPCLGAILRRANKKSRIICIADNIIPHEKRPGDKPFTRYFVKPVDAFITMSEKVQKDLRKFTAKPSKLVPHPLYDAFGPAVGKAEARAHLKLPQNEKIVLFFGFIRKYKGLDLLLTAMQELKDVHLLIAGEFYDGKEGYNLDGQNIIDRTGFIPDKEIPYYFGAADFVIQPYISATQSGVTPLAYFYEKAMLVTNVGGLPDLVRNSGVVVEPEPKAIAKGIMKLYEKGEAHFQPYLKEEKKKYSWETLAKTILELAAAPEPNA